MNNEKIRPYQPIDSYGMIGDCYSALLVAPDGAIDWGRLPDFNSPAFFCRLLDAKRGGYFQIAPTDTAILGSQHYLHDSSVLRTTFASETGKIVLTDFVSVETLDARSCHARDKNNNSQDIHNRLIRQVACLEGEIPITMTLKVTPNYGYAPCEAFLIENNTGAVLSGNDQHVGLFVAGESCVTAFTIRLQEDPQNMHPVISAQVVLHEGERIQFVLGTGNSLNAARELVEADLPQRNFDWEMAQTLSCWRKWVATRHHGPYRGGTEAVCPSPHLVEKVMRREPLARPGRYDPNCQKQRAGYPATRRAHR